MTTLASNTLTTNTFTTNDGTTIYYKDWGKGKPVTFSHGWPLNADAWDAQMLFLAQHGYRVIAHDRRGHGRSGQTWDGNEMNTYADDLAGLLDALDIKGAMMVGHSTGGGEVARYLGRHGSKRVSKAVLIGAVPPLMLKTDKNPEGLPLSAFDQIALLETLNILEGFDLAALGDRTPESMHLIIEAFRRAFKDRTSFLGDPDFQSMPTQQLIDKGYAAAWRKSINMTMATPSSALTRPPGYPPGRESGAACRGIEADHALFRAR